MGRVQGPFRDDTPAGDLQRALDMEIVDHLRTQNAKLMEEIDRLKKHRSQHGSTSSWSEVGGATTAGAGMLSGSVGSVADGSHERGGYHTPRSSQKPVKNQVHSKWNKNP